MIIGRHENQLRLLDRFLKTENRTLPLLLLMAAIGIYGFLPAYNGRSFHPIALILVIFPVVLTMLARVYLQICANGFRLIKREMPSVCLENELMTVQLEIGYNSPLPFSSASISENFPAIDILSTPEIELYYQDFVATGSHRISYSHQLNRGYGNFMIGPAEITLRDPLGLFEKKLIFQATTPLKVWLNTPPPEELDLIKANALTPLGDSRSTQSGRGMDFFGIKEYAPGDDIRAMSWLKTAQAGKPVIKQFERDTRPDVFVAVHTDKQQLRGLGFGNTVKRMMRIATAILAETQRRGLPESLGLCINNEACCIPVNSAMPIYGFMTELLGTLEPAGESGLQQLLDLTMRKAGPGSVVIFLSHTINLRLDLLLHGLMTLQARGAKVSLWAINDSDQARFSMANGETISLAEFQARLEELDLKCVLLSSKKDLSVKIDR